MSGASAAGKVEAKAGCASPLLAAQGDIGAPCPSAPEKEGQGTEQPSPGSRALGLVMGDIRAGQHVKPSKIRRQVSLSLSLSLPPFALSLSLSLSAYFFRRRSICIHV